MSGVTAITINEKNINVPFPCSGNSLRTLSEMLEEAENQGYRLVDATIVRGGHQLDETVNGVNLKLKKP